MCIWEGYLGLHIIIEYVGSEGEPPVGGEDSSNIVGECTLAKIIQQSFSISVLSQVPIDKYACTINNLCAPVACALSDCSYVRIATVFSCIVLVSKLSMQLSACAFPQC